MWNGKRKGPRDDKNFICTHACAQAVLRKSSEVQTSQAGIREIAGDGGEMISTETSLESGLDEELEVGEEELCVPGGGGVGLAFFLLNATRRSERRFSPSRFSGYTREFGASSFPSFTRTTLLQE